MPQLGATYYDRQEVRSPADREASIFAALPGLFRHTLDNAPSFAARLGSIDPDEVTDRDTLAQIPVLRKSDLLELQQESLPFGGMAATDVSRLARIFASPGPTFDPEGTRRDYWRFARAMYAAGFRAGDLVHNSFSYHLTPAGFMVDCGARALCCPVVPGGTGQTELQARVINDLRPIAYAGTPSFLKILLEQARALDLDTGSLQKALVAGEAFLAPWRDELIHEYRINAYQCYGTADLGLIAYESSARDGLIVDESVIVEIVRPGGDDPLPAGDVGEVVVTAFNPDYPLIRFGTGDLSAILTGESPCGRTNVRIKGWMGRADQSAKVRGMFVHPTQIAALIRQHPEVVKARLVVSRVGDADHMRLQCETDDRDDAHQKTLINLMRAITGLRAEVELVAKGLLPNDGKVIDDQRQLS